MVDSETLERRLALTRAALAPPAGAKARVHAKLGAGSLAAAGASSLAAAGAKSAARVGVTKLTTALLVGVGFLAGYLLGLQQTSAPLAAVSVSEPAPSQQAVSNEALSDEALSDETLSNEAVSDETAADQAMPPAAAVPVATPPRALSKSASNRERRLAGAASAPHAQSGRGAAPGSAPFAEELALLQRAERAIRTEQAPLALVFLDELDRRFPKSTLIEERTAARLLAECELSEAGARERAESFLKSRAGSVYSDRVRRFCKLEAAPTSPPSNDGSLTPGH